MEEIKVNEYVRTKRGEICKVLGIREEQRAGKRVYSHLAYYLDNHKGSLTPAFIVKHSPNIIDLIEVGDIVHTRDILNEDYYFMYDESFIRATKEDIENGIELVDILTHEQYQQNCYKV